jgi:hypothetical protein
MNEAQTLERAFKDGLKRWRKFDFVFCGSPTPLNVPDVEQAAKAKFFELCTGKTSDPRFMAGVKATAGDLARLASISIQVEHRRRRYDQYAALGPSLTSRRRPIVNREG